MIAKYSNKSHNISTQKSVMVVFLEILSPNDRNICNCWHEILLKNPSINTVLLKHKNQCFVLL